MTPALACRLRLFETVIDPPVVRFIGDPGRLGPEVMKGFVMSPAAAFEYFVGDVLKMLTVHEQMLIALHYPRCFVFKLFPKRGDIRDPDILQRGMIGNVTTYAQNMDDISKMLEGNLMPR